MATDPRERLGEFAGFLREHGFSLGYAEVELMTRAAGLVPVSQWARIESLWRGIASGSRKQWSKYPALYQAFWFPHRVRGTTRSSGVTRRGRTLPELVQELQGAPGTTPPVPTAAGGISDRESAAAEAGDEARHAQGGASRTEALDQRDFADWTPEDIDRFEPLVDAFQRRLRVKLLRRWDATKGRYAVHLRRSLRSALGTGGELINLRYVRRRRHKPHIVLLVDVSRSMETHAHFFLRLARAFVEVAEARAFVFHTRLADITPLLKRRSGRVQEKINAVTFGFGGGTRIASCVSDAFDRHMARSLCRGDFVLIFSDGYDTDAPGHLAEVLSSIRARGAHVLWLHPTKLPPASAAMLLARGQVSRFIPAHNLASLSRLPQWVA
jgi:uncharacterized protein with von Willebrand factor type A (vWA) domain